MKKFLFAILAVCMLSLSTIAYILLNKPSLTTGKVDFFQSITIEASNGKTLELKGSDGDCMLALEVKDHSIQPPDGIRLADAKIRIIDYLRTNGIEGEIEEVAKIEEITTNEIWSNNNIQLYIVEVDYASIYGVAVLKNNTVISVLSGMPTEGVFLADLDNDKIYEIYTNIYFGSGIVSKEILGYNPKTNEKYKLSGRFKKGNYENIDYTLYIKDNSLFAKTESASGLLVLTNKDGKNGLEIDYVK